MLPRKNRLDPKEINQKLSKKIKGEGFILVFEKQAGIKKLGVVISKKVAKNAVDRNRIRRLFSESIKGLQFEGKIKVIVTENLSSLKKIEVEKRIIQKLKNL